MRRPKMSFPTSDFFSIRRWPRTLMLGRLGTIAATLCGLATAFNLGGQDGYTIPLTALLGAPMNGVLFGIVHFFAPSLHIDVTSNAGAAHWSVYHLLFCGAVALNWTFWGFVCDLTNPPESEPDLVSSRDLREPTPLSGGEELRSDHPVTPVRVPREHDRFEDRAA